MKIKQSLLTRRDFLNNWISASGTLTGGIITYSIFSALLPKFEDDDISEINLSAEYSQLTPNSSRQFFFGRTPAILIMSDQGELIALQAVCTHFECAVHYDPAEKKLICPCHQGFFDIYGNNLAGPPPRPLFRYRVQRMTEGLLIFREQHA